MIDERKVAQMAAYLLLKRGGRMSHLKLIKMLYLADRESLERFGFPMSGDKPVSMEHGPALSTTLNLINGCVKSIPGGWEDWISDRENHEVSLARESSFNDLDELSQADLDILSAVWEKYGHMGRWEIRDYTHENCPEWEDPSGSSSPIPYKRILGHVGWEDSAEKQSNDIARQDRIDRILAAL